MAGVATVDVSATTAAIADDAVYVVHPYFDDPAAKPFIERVEIRSTMRPMKGAIASV